MSEPLIIGVLSDEQSQRIVAGSQPLLPAGISLQPVAWHKQRPENNAETVLADDGTIVGFPGEEEFRVNGMLVEQSLPSEFPDDIPFCTVDALVDSDLRHSFIAAVCARAEFDAMCAQPLTAYKLIQFHSHYKMLLLAHSQPLYRELGPLVAGVAASSSLNEFARQYRRKLMQILMLPANRRDNTNALMHMQGYFRPFITGQRRQHLTETIDQYRRGLQPLTAAIDELRHLQAEYPHPWLASQRFLFPWLPDAQAGKTQQEIP